MPSKHRATRHDRPFASVAGSYASRVDELAILSQSPARDQHPSIAQQNRAVELARHVPSTRSATMRSTRDRNKAAEREM